MTQEVQPLTWQKRTNLEEHQQFFSKINEIIDNLAPTVDEAEAAIAQATAAIASANDAIATANAASAAASAAASQAQTAASTVAGYNTRLTAAEGDIDALQAADQTITGNVTALGTRMTAAESKNSQQDTSIAALQTADTNNVKITGTHAIGDYAVLLTNNQPNIAGRKTFVEDVTVRKLNPGYATVDTRDYADLTNANIVSSKSAIVQDGTSSHELTLDQVRVSGFGVIGGVERLMFTNVKVDGTWKSVILRIQVNPATNKAVLRFGNTVIAEVDI